MGDARERGGGASAREELTAGVGVCRPGMGVRRNPYRPVNRDPEEEREASRWGFICRKQGEHSDFSDQSGQSGPGRVTCKRGWRRHGIPRAA